MRTRIWSENLKGGDQCGLDSSDSGEGPVASCCEHSNEPSVSIKFGELLD
jgi:hypothetical protein